ncbi:MAG: PA2778 family cysteine peptidase [Ideonella sp.]
MIAAIGPRATLGAATLLVGGCATQTTQLREHRPAGLPPEVELDETPFFPQTAYDCGPAALAAVLGAIGVPSDPVVLAQRVFTPARQGSLQIEMITGARRALVVPTRIPGSLEAIMREVAAGHPVVVLQNLGLDVLPVWHYAVVVGYSLPRQELILRSGVNPREMLPLLAFELSWVRAGSWGFVVTPPGQWPNGAQQQAMVDACVGFERVAPAALGQAVYASALARWPGNLALMVGLGNTAFAAGNKVLAADSFESAARLHDSAAAWINLGRTLLDAGLAESAWRVALEAEYLDNPAWRSETTALLRDALAARQPARLTR